MSRASRRPSRRPSMGRIRDRDCQVTLPVEIGVMVNVRSSCESGHYPGAGRPSRTRGGMSIEPPFHQHQHQVLVDEELGITKIKDEGPLPVLQEILKKQQAILKNLAYSGPLHLTPRKRRSTSSSLHSNKGTIRRDSKLSDIGDSDDKILNDDSKSASETDSKILENNELKKEESTERRRSQRKITIKKYDKQHHDEVDSFSEGIKVNSNISFDNNNDDNDIEDEIVDEKKRKPKKSKRLKGGGRKDFPLADTLEGETNSYHFDIQDGHMIELFNRRKLKINKVDPMTTSTTTATNHHNHHDFSTREGGGGGFRNHRSTRNELLGLGGAHSYSNDHHSHHHNHGHDHDEDDYGHEFDSILNPRRNDNLSKSGMDDYMKN